MILEICTLQLCFLYFGAIIQSLHNYDDQLVRHTLVKNRSKPTAGHMCEVGCTSSTIQFLGFLGKFGFSVGRGRLDYPSLTRVKWGQSCTIYMGNEEGMRHDIYDNKELLMNY